MPHTPNQHGRAHSRISHSPPNEEPLRVTPDIARLHSQGRPRFQPQPGLLNISWRSHPLRSKDLPFGVLGFVPTPAALDTRGLKVHHADHGPAVLKAVMPRNPWLG